MAHLTSQWAHRYGLPDPAVPAEQVRRATEDGLRACAVRFAAAGLALRAGGDRTLDVAGALRAGWSTPQAEGAVADVGAACDGLAERCRRFGDCLSELAAAVEASHDAVDRAFDRADAAITAEMLAAEPLATNAAELARLAQRRSQVVGQTHAATSSALGLLDEAATRASTVLAVDPRQLLPASLIAGARAASAPDSGANSAARLDAANRTTLQEDLRSGDARRSLFAHAVQAALDEARRAGGAAQLLGYDPDGNSGQGAAAVAVGDVARADAVSVLVPGVGNSPMEMSGSVRLGADLAAATGHVGGAGTTGATVVWFGYDVPLSWTKDRIPRGPISTALGDSAIALDATAAVPAAATLGAFAHTLRSVMGPTAGLTLIGHSYGSTVVSQAARTLDRDAGVEDIVLLGSPGAGVGVESAGDYRAVPRDHVYTLAFPADPIPNGVTDVVATLLNPFGLLAQSLVLGGGEPFGADPNAPGFGAQAIAAPSGEAWNGGVDLAQHALHNYLSGPALDAVAMVAAGRYSRVPVRQIG